MADERAVAVVLEAIEKALAVRGAVMLESTEDERHWCVAVGATDGRLEVRVGEPRKRLWRRSDGDRWLEDHGFIHRIDAWSLPVAAWMSPETCAQTLVAALTDALGWTGEPLYERLVHPGFAGEDPPPPDAPHEAHIAAAARALIGTQEGRADIEGGVPAAPRAWMWAEPDQATLLVEYDHDEDEWRVPLTAAGAEAAARELARRLAADFPDFHTAPLFIGLIGLD